MRTNILGLILLASLSACGGGGGDSSNSTTFISCPGQEVNIGDIENIAAAAQAAGVEVVESEDAAPSELPAEPENQGSLDQGATLREDGVIVATCGSSVGANEDNDIVNGAARVLARINSGEVYRIEIYRGR